MPRARDRRMGAQMPENPEKPSEGDLPSAPAEPVKPMAELAEGDVKVSPQALPIAAKELATEEVIADPPTSVPVPTPAPAVVAEEQEAMPPTAATTRVKEKHP